MAQFGMDESPYWDKLATGADSLESLGVGP